jgi:hypothetical protein
MHQKIIDITVRDEDRTTLMIRNIPNR